MARDLASFRDPGEVAGSRRWAGPGSIRRDPATGQAARRSPAPLPARVPAAARALARAQLSPQPRAVAPVPVPVRAPVRAPVLALALALALARTAARCRWCSELPRGPVPTPVGSARTGPPRRSPARA